MFVASQLGSRTGIELLERSVGTGLAESVAAVVECVLAGTHVNGGCFALARVE